MPLQRAPVRGISIKLQEEERERRDQYVPEVSAIAAPGGIVKVDADVQDLLQHIGFGNLPGLTVDANANAHAEKPQRRERRERPAKQ